MLIPEGAALLSRGAGTPWGTVLSPSSIGALRALLAALAGARGVSGFQRHKELLPRVGEHPGKGGRAGGTARWAFRAVDRFAAKAKRPEGFGRCEYIHCVDKEMIKSSIVGNQFAYVNTET